MSSWDDDPRSEIKTVKISMPAFLWEELVTRARRSCPGVESDRRVLSEYLRRAVSVQKFIEDYTDRHDDGVSLADVMLRAAPTGPSFEATPAHDEPVEVGERAAAQVGVTQALEQLRDGLFLDAEDTLIAVHRRLTPRR